MNNVGGTTDVIVIFPPEGRPETFELHFGLQAANGQHGQQRLVLRGVRELGPYRQGRSRGGK